MASQTIKLNESGLTKAQTSLSDAETRIASSSQDVQSIEFNDKRLVPSIKKKMTNAIHSLEAELNSLEVIVRTYYDDISTIITTIKNLDDVEEEKTGLFWWETTTHKSTDEETLEDSIIQLKEAGLMSTCHVFSSAQIESPFDKEEYYPEDKESRETWEKELVEKYKNQGYTEEEAKSLASYEIAQEEVKKTGATVLAGGYALSDLRNKKEQVTDKKQATDLLSEERIIYGDERDISYQERDSQDDNDNNNGNNNSNDTGDNSSVQYRTESNSSTTSYSQPESNRSEKEPSASIGKQEKANKNNVEKPDKSSLVDNSSTNTNNDINTDTGNSNTNNDTSTDTGNSNTNNDTNTDTGNSNMNNDTSTDTGNSNANNDTNTDVDNSNSNHTTPTPEPPLTNNNVPTNNPNTGNNDQINTDTDFNNNNSGNNEIVTPPITDSNNESTTTPSAPDSDNGIIDNSGDELSVISIDKDGSTQPSTTSKDGGSAIPVILGVGAAGAAAVAGAKFIKDRKEKENVDNPYEEDSTQEENNTFSYVDNYNNDNNSTDDDLYNEPMSNIEKSTRYKAGNVNKLILDEAPTDIKIKTEIPGLENQKEELE